MSDLPRVLSQVELANGFLGDAIQICVVTPDYRRIMAGFVKAGIGPWRVYTFSPDTVSEMTYRGRPARYSMKLCLAFSGSMMWEIVQPLEGPSLYTEFLEGHGEGVHHIAVNCKDVPYEERIREFEARGFRMVQSGKWMDTVPYHYFETDGAIGTTIEIFNIPADFPMPEPEEWYPAAPTA